MFYPFIILNNRTIYTKLHWLWECQTFIDSQASVQSVPHQVHWLAPIPSPSVYLSPGGNCPTSVTCWMYGDSIWTHVPMFVCSACIYTFLGLNDFLSSILQDIRPLVPSKHIHWFVLYYIFTGVKKWSIIQINIQYL